MTDADLFRRRSDPTDARRVFVELSPIASHAMRRYFHEIGNLQSVLSDYPGGCGNWCNSLGAPAALRGTADASPCKLPGDGWPWRNAEVLSRQKRTKVSCRALLTIYSTGSLPGNSCAGWIRHIIVCRQAYTTSAGIALPAADQLGAAIAIIADHQTLALARS